MRLGNGRRVIALAAFLAALILAGCGNAGAVGGGSGGSIGGASSGVTSPCAGRAVASRATPTVILRPTDASHAANAPVGSIVEIRLDAQHVWRLGEVSPAGALTPQRPQGALEQGECLWDFTVARAGDATVSFTGSPNCPPLAMCPQYALLTQFTIHGS